MSKGKSTKNLKEKIKAFYQNVPRKKEIKSYTDPSLRKDIEDKEITIQNNREEQGQEVSSRNKRIYECVGVIGNEEGIE